MTDSPEIKAIVSLLYKIWSRYPDQRLDQLLNHIIPGFGFFTDNTKLLAHLRDYQARLEGEQLERV
jgi:uncharacterized protein YihD (DUF1040 family)